MEKANSEPVGLPEAFAVAQEKARHSVGKADTKMLSIFLRQGECTAEISASKIAVWHSWLKRPLPSIYYINLAPALVGQLMELGRVERVADEAIFPVGPGSTGTGSYSCKFARKWIRLQCQENRILIRVRDEQKDLYDREPEHFGKVVLCERCNGVLRTPLAKQCLHCGYDWH